MDPYGMQVLLLLLLLPLLNALYYLGSSQYSPKTLWTLQSPVVD